ncbi:MAG: TIGR02099 family protein, partial [Betaproteobacteria bacterium]|nr:TIGR02099 family protein [Betaproteobacteria bacterium]
MTNNTNLPIVSAKASRWWRGYAWCVRVLWWLALSAWSLVAVAALALHFWIVPRVLDWKSDIEAMASQALGVKVSIGNLETLSTNWLPSLEITDFVLRNAADEEVLRLPRVLVSLSPTSLLTLSLDRVDIDSPLIEVTRDSEGALRIAGLSMGQAQPSALADWFWSQPEIFVHRGRLRWVDQKASLPAVELHEVNVALRNGL